MKLNFFFHDVAKPAELRLTIFQVAWHLENKKIILGVVGWKASVVRFKFQRELVLPNGMRCLIARRLSVEHIVHSYTPIYSFPT